MIELDVYRGEPIGLPQETFGADVVETCTQTAVDHFFEAKNAALGPLLNAPGLTMLYAENAVMDVEMPGPARPLESRCRGIAEIQAFYEALGKLMLSIVAVETGRRVIGRTATWRGRLDAVDCRTRERVAFDAVYRLEFDDFDLVSYQWSRLTPGRAD